MTLARRVPPRSPQPDDATVRRVSAEIRDALMVDGDASERVLGALDSLSDGDNCPRTLDDVKSLTPEEHLRYRDAVDKILTEGSRPVVVPAEPHEQPSAPKSTGISPVGEADAGKEFRPLSWEELRTMAPEEHIRRRAEIDKFLAQGGRG